MEWLPAAAQVLLALFGTGGLTTIVLHWLRDRRVLRGAKDKALQTAMTFLQRHYETVIGGMEERYHSDATRLLRRVQELESQVDRLRSELAALASRGGDQGGQKPGGGLD